MKINKTKLYENLVDFENIANINILVCFDSLFSKLSLIKNVGSYIIIIILHIINCFIFYIKQLNKIKKKIKKISFGINNFDLIDINIKGKSKNKSFKNDNMSNSKNKEIILEPDKNSKKRKHKKKINKKNKNKKKLIKTYKY